MELVFVHIAEHKILENISFDINSRFKCHFNKGELSITTGDRLDSYYNDILISAVIGKNGVGKSSFFEFIQESYYNSESSGVLVWHCGIEKIFYICPINLDLSNVEVHLEAEYKICNDAVSFYKAHKINNIIVDNISIAGLSRNVNKRRKNRLIHNLTPSLSSSKIVRKNNLMKLLYFFNSSVWLKPDRKDIKINFDFEFKPSPLTFIQGLHNSLKKDGELSSRVNITEDRFVSCFKLWKEALRESNFVHNCSLRKYLLLANLPSIVNYLSSLNLIKKQDKPALALSLFVLFMENKFNFESEKLTSVFKEASILGNLEFGMPSHDPEILEINFQGILEIFDEISKLVSHHSIEFNQAYQHQEFLIKSFTAKNSSFILYLADLISKLPNLISNNFNYGWVGISSGELAKIRLFSELYYLIKNKTTLSEDYKLIVIDEADLYLHPEWQRTFFSELIVFLSHEFNKDNLQVIVTTHSPIIISDFLTDDIISLSKNHGKVDVVKSLGFGTQITDLYLSSMHLESTFGEHSKKALTTLLEKGKASELNAEDMALIKTINNENIEQMITGNTYD